MATILDLSFGQHQDWLVSEAEKWRMYFVILLFLMTFHARDGKIRHSQPNENASDSDNVDDVLVANKKGDHIR